MKNHRYLSIALACSLVLTPAMSSSLPDPREIINKENVQKGLAWGAIASYGTSGVTALAALYNHLKNNPQRAQENFGVALATLVSGFTLTLASIQDSYNTHFVVNI